MIDILTVKQGDTIEYENYQCSESLREERRYGVYQGYELWSPDGRPVELWIVLITNDAPVKKLVRASQVTNVIPAMAEASEEPTMVPCPYCRQFHYVGTVERCPLKPRQ